MRKILAPNLNTRWASNDNPKPNLVDSKVRTGGGAEYISEENQRFFSPQFAAQSARTKSSKYGFLGVWGWGVVPYKVGLIGLSCVILCVSYTNQDKVSLSMITLELRRTLSPSSVL